MVKQKKLSSEALELVADRFKILSEPLRLRVLHCLQSGEKSVGELADETRASQPNISKHLKILQTSGMVHRRQDGNMVFYSIADNSIFKLCDLVCGSLSEHLRIRADVFSGR
jgi:ArsR family transcriptional regulator